MVEEIKKVIESPIEDLGYILSELEYTKEDGQNVLLVSIDTGTDKNITVEDCIKVTEIINPIIDELDPIKENYVLDVCSKERGN